MVAERRHNFFEIAAGIVGVQEVEKRLALVVRGGLPHKGNLRVHQ